jgi:hypothetical protein
MRLGPLILLALIALVAPSTTYAQGPPPQAVAHFAHLTTVSPDRGTASPDHIVARLMSFDRNDDGKVQTAELAERMQGVMARGDVDKDGALDQTELLALATAPPAQVAVRGFQHGNYLVGG